MQPSLKTYELTLENLTYGGEAMGRLPDGRAVFVPFALPGERARVRLTEEKRSYARAELLEVLQPSPRRIAPRCPHFGACGGCHYQHLAYPDQLQAKQAILREQLQRIAGLAEPPVLPIVPSPQEWNYRNAVQFHLTPQGQLGYLAPNSHTVVPIRECHLPQPAIAETWPLLDFESLPGLERVELRAGAGDELMLVLESQDPRPPQVNIELELSAVFLSPAGALLLGGERQIVMEVSGRAFQLSAGSFFQVNTAMAERMVAHVLELLPLGEGETVLDVYCGVGLFSAFLAPRCGRLVGVELSEAACEDFAANLDEFDKVELYVGAAEEILPALDLRPQAVLVDPPRAGLEKPALEALAAMGAERLVYVSCDPATLARDAKRLAAAGYRLQQVTPFDLFPQTFHLESISLFVKDL